MKLAMLPLDSRNCQSSITKEFGDRFGRPPFKKFKQPAIDEIPLRQGDEQPQSGGGPGPGGVDCVGDGKGRKP